MCRAEIAKTLLLPTHPAMKPSRYCRLVNGDVVDGKYRVTKQIGEGGMAFVVEAQHVELRHLVAIKYLRPEALARPDMVGRFHAEGRIAVQLKGDHVIRTTDAGTLENGAPYLVMELLEGTDLAHLLERRGVPFDVPHATQYILEACDALAEAHAAGIVHRDLKPENLFLVRRSDGTEMVKVIDFGISSSDTYPQAATTATGDADRAEIVGSPAYMSPEQVRNFRAVDARADIWALGVILYELLTGALVFEDRSVEILLAKVCRDLPEPARRRRAGIPRALDNVILRCLEKNPAHRFQSVAELAEALLPFAPAAASAADRVRCERFAPSVPGVGPQDMFEVPTLSCRILWSARAFFAAARRL